MCGIVGVYDPSGNAGAHVVDALLRGQHRGQDGAGASFLTEQGVITHKGHGLVAEVFRNVEIPRSRLAIGHVRYGTQAASLDSTINDRDASPLEIVVNGRTLGAIVHNGDFVGGMQLLEQYNGRRKTGVDTELFVLRFVDSTAGALDQRVKDALLPVKEGAYSLIGLVGDQLFAVRDPLGIRPLVFAAADGVEMFASESYMCNGFQNITDVGPGSLVMVGDNHPRSYQSLFHPSFKSARCAFEFIYFSRPESVGSMLLIVKFVVL
ncbi:MAG: hypothetical protein Q7R96_06170 [Nanoarchaeota archaeon]|nr:hypothetical protein [Nanoarchaeota archaeon]